MKKILFIAALAGAAFFILQEEGSLRYLAPQGVIILSIRSPPLETFEGRASLYPQNLRTER